MNYWSISDLDESLGSSVVGSHSLSSVLLIPQESGAGLTVETHNINYCTIAMYRNALLTAGVQDAKVIVVAPMPSVAPGCTDRCGKSV